MTAAIDASTWLAVTALASLSILSTALGVGLAYWVGPLVGWSERRASGSRLG